MKKLLLLLFISTNFIISSYSVKTHIPKNAKPLLPVVYQEVHRLMPTHFIPPYFPALIEHESCISLTHSKCWNSRSELRTYREQGVGLGQVTRAWRVKGGIKRLRFDNLTNLKIKYPKEFKGVTWSNFKYKPKEQIAATILLYREVYRKLSSKKFSVMDRLLMSDAAYNGGYGDLRKERIRCKIRKGCNQYIWFGNVESITVKSTRRNKVYGGKSMYQINRRHVKDVFYNRLNKYYIHWVTHILKKY